MGLLSILFSLGFRTKTMYVLPLPHSATCPNRFVLLDLISRVMFDEDLVI
jgi:hypothetical protein